MEARARGHTASGALPRSRGGPRLGPLLALLAFAGCARPAPEPIEPFVLALPRSTQASLAHVAVATGAFAAEGLALTVRPHDLGRAALEDVLAGNADLAVSAESPVVFARLRGEPAVVIATVSTSTRSNRLYALRGAIAGPGDLAGKRVALPAGTSATFLLESLLLRHGVDLASVRWVDLPPAGLAGALERGDVDAVVAWHPYTLELERRLPGRVVAFQAGNEYWTVGAAVALADRVRARRGVMEKALRALLRAEAFARERPGEARRLAALASETPLSDLEVMWPDFDFRVGLDHGLVVLMEREARWAVRAGLSAPAARDDFRDAIAPGPLSAVRPQLVRLIR